MLEFTPSLESKLPHVKTTIFTQMSALANEHKAINLSQGFPGFTIDRVLPKLVGKFMLEGANQYAPMAGVEALRKTIVKEIQNRYNTQYNHQEEITITAGATQAIFTAISSVINKGDEVIMFSPSYDCYSPAIEINGGICKYVSLLYPSYTIDWSKVKSLISTKTKMIIINSPHNPTGNILSRQDIVELEEIIDGSNIILLSDEVYEHIVYDNQEHFSVMKSKILAKNSFITFSFGKSLHVTGWKLGYCLAPQKLMKEFRKVHQFNVFSCNTPMQYAINEYIKKYNPFEDISGFYEEKRDLFLNLLKGSRFEILPSKGTYFQLLKYDKITSEYDVDFAKRLTIENKVASIPISVFNHDKRDEKVLRFCFAKEDDTLIKAAKILCEI